MKLEDLQERLQQLKTDNEAILAKAEAEKRELTQEEGDTFDSNQSAFESTKRNVERLQKDADQHELLTRGTGRISKPDQPARLAKEDDEDRPAPKNGRVDIRPINDYATLKNGGFRSLGEMAFHVQRASRHGGQADPRLERLAAASTIGNESSGSDGGFAVPPDFRNAIMATVLGEDSLLGRCDQVTVSGNTFTCPADETNPWQTSGGIQAYWDGETAAANQSKPALQEKTVKLNKIRCLIPMTDELLDDASAMDAYLRRKAPEKIAFKLNLAILQGTGVGQPLGILNSPSLVTVSKFVSQTADTLTAGNVINMYSRMYAPSRSKAVWLINQDIEPQLMKLAIPGTDDVGNSVTGWGGLVYMPANGLSGAPYGTLYGRPVIPTQACETLGDKGDIIFADLSQYLALIKGGQNPKVETSMHLWFDQDIMAFKFVLRVGGMPWWSTTQAARDGSATYSPFVTLEAR
jgi:HK97 family phage major capsid protein